MLEECRLDILGLNEIKLRRGRRDEEGQRSKARGGEKMKYKRERERERVAVRKENQKSNFQDFLREIVHMKEVLECEKCVCIRNGEIRGEERF